MKYEIKKTCVDDALSILFTVLQLLNELLLLLSDNSFADIIHLKNSMIILRCGKNYSITRPYIFTLTMPIVLIIGSKFLYATSSIYRSTIGETD